MMKIIKYLFLILGLSAFKLNAQVAIGKSAVQGSSVLDFADSTTKGIILPAVTAFPGSPANGTLLLYQSKVLSTANVYMYENNTWKSMTEGDGNPNPIIDNGSAEIGNGVIIGASTSSASGVLVLESSSLALTLPKVASPHLNVKSPYPGMICYDTTSNTIAVFDGAYWNFWK